LPHVTIDWAVAHPLPLLDLTLHTRMPMIGVANRRLTAATIISWVYSQNVQDR